VAKYYICTESHSLSNIYSKCYHHLDAQYYVLLTTERKQTPLHHSNTILVTSINHTQIYISNHSANEIRLIRNKLQDILQCNRYIHFVKKVKQSLMKIYTYLTELHVLKLYLKYLCENIGKSCIVCDTQL